MMGVWLELFQMIQCDWWPTGCGPACRTRYIDALCDNDTQQAEEAGANGGAAAMQLQVTRPPDSLSSLLALLAGLFGVYPALGTDDNLRCSMPPPAPSDVSSCIVPGIAVHREGMFLQIVCLWQSALGHVLSFALYMQLLGAQMPPRPADSLPSHVQGACV